MKSQYVVLDEHQSPLERMVASVHLAVELTKAELRNKQFQRLLGPVWWVIEPSLMSLVFFFLTERVNYSTGSNHFMFIFIGLTVWRFFQRSVENSSYAYVSYGYVIRQVYFPLLSVNLATLFTEFVYFCSGFLFVFIFGFSFSKLAFGWSYLFLPLLIVSQGLFTLSVMILVASIGVYLRDLPSPLAIMLNVGFFLSPGIYSVDQLPRYLGFLPWVNPFYYYFPAYRAVLLENRILPLAPLAMWTFISLLLLGVGLFMYRRIRPNLLRVL